MSKELLRKVVEELLELTEFELAYLAGFMDIGSAKDIHNELVTLREKLSLLKISLK